MKPNHRDGACVRAECATSYQVPKSITDLVRRAAGSEAEEVHVAEGKDHSEPPLRFEILGPLRVLQGDREVPLGPGKQRAVLAVLLVNANRPVLTSRVVDAVWEDDPPQNGPNVVQKYVAGLRRLLEPDRSPRTPGRTLTLTAAGYLLRVAPGYLDLDRFGERVRQARSLRAEAKLIEAAATFRQALARCTSPYSTPAAPTRRRTRPGGSGRVLRLGAWVCGVSTPLKVGRGQRASRRSKKVR
jgi:hypothetical protein